MDNDFLFEVVADYRGLSMNSPKYYVFGKNKADARRRFSEKMSWLTIYSVNKCDDNFAKDIVNHPYSYMFW